MYVSFIASYFTVKIPINNDELGFKYEFERRLEHLVSKELYPLNHLGGYEDNRDAHLKRTIMGREVVIAITNGDFDSGPWEQIFYYEMDGKRDKRVLIKIIGE